MKIKRLHHVAIICSDYQRSKKFYTEVLGLEILAENYRGDRDSYKLDLSLNGEYLIELFSFPQAPERVTRPEALGLRHVAFEVENLEKALRDLEAKGIETEEVRIDPYTGKKFTFFFDPDNLPVEFYENDGKN
jgi:glyoxylase I family protein